MPSTLLPTFRFADGACIAQAHPRPLHLVSVDSPALSVMTDLTEVRAATVGADLALEQVEEAMI